MFVINPSPTLSKIYKTKSKIIKEYLIKNEIPILSQADGVFYFSETTKLYNILDNAPLYIRCLK